jgi:predicted MPP superfamily phosphohydrolase
MLVAILLFVILFFIYSSIKFFYFLHVKFSKVASFYGALAFFFLAQTFIINFYLHHRLGINIPLWWENFGSGVLVFIFFFGLMQNLVGILSFIPQINSKTAGREFAIGLIILALSSGLVGYGFYHTTQNKIKTYNVESSKLKQNLKIAVLSDLHINSKGITPKRLAKIVQDVNAQSPDMVLLVGDILDNTYKPFITGNYAPIFAKLKSKYGTYAVLGNHEYYGEGGDIAEQVLSRNTGIKFLRDEVLNLPKLQLSLIGRDDIGRGRLVPLKRLSELEKLANQKFKLVMVHRPVLRKDSLSEFVGNADLIISGHTHNGQLFPFNYIVQLIYHNAYGLEYFNHASMITTSGVGLWGPPIRIGTKSEIVIVNLRKM